MKKSITCVTCAHSFAPTARLVPFHSVHCELEDCYVQDTSRCPRYEFKRKYAK